MRVHFIAIGGAAMHNLAITLQQNGDTVTGSDDEILEPSRSRLKHQGLLPEKTGWFPEKITGDIDTVIIGMHAKSDNPELLEAKRKGLYICSFPEFLFQKTRDKIRVVIAGNHEKTDITAMIIFVLKKTGVKFDYLIGTPMKEFELMVALNDETRIAVFEGDEYLTSALNPQPKFHLYQPHVAVVTGIEWNHPDTFLSFSNYIEQFRIFANLIERNGKFIYAGDDDNLQKIASEVRADITSIPYQMPVYETVGNKNILKTKYGDFPLRLFGKYNLQNIEAAHLACRQLGIQDKEFYETITGFEGTVDPLNQLAENKRTSVFAGSGISPSRIRTLINTLKERNPDRKVILLLELTDPICLSPDFLMQYPQNIADAEQSFILFDIKKWNNGKKISLSREKIKTIFGERVSFLFSGEELSVVLKELDLNHKNLLFMNLSDYLTEITAFPDDTLK